MPVLPVTVMTMVVTETYHTVRIELLNNGPQTIVSLTQDTNPSEQARDHATKKWQ